MTPSPEAVKEAEKAAFVIIEEVTACAEKTCPECRRWKKPIALALSAAHAAGRRDGIEATREVIGHREHQEGGWAGVILSLLEAADLVIDSACQMPMDSFRDAPERWRDSFGALQSSIAVLAFARDREKTLTDPEE